jgi:hypothetical protein
MVPFGKYTDPSILIVNCVFYNLSLLKRKPVDTFFLCWYFVFDCGFAVFILHNFTAQ